MSAPMVLACAAAALCIGVPVIVAATQVEARHSAAAAADAAALAAADAMSGWIDAEPCALAQDVGAEMKARIVECVVDAARADARVVAETGRGLQRAQGRARAVAPHDPGAGRYGVFGPVGANGWAWPSDVRGVTQAFHDGYSIDLAVSAEGVLFAPYDGVVVAAGPDGGRVPNACVAKPWWWHGPNITVIMRHETPGGTIFSSHNHVDPGSLSALGIRPGTPVSAGQQVATAGMTGCTSGPHSHFTLSTTPSNASANLNPFEYFGSP